MIVLYIIGAFLLILMLVVLIRALMFRPHKESVYDAADKVPYPDTDAMITGLSEMIKCKTVSNADRSLEDASEFEKFKRLMPALFPKVYECCEYEEPSDRSMLLRWRGESELEPTLLMAHYDVVGADSEAWEKPPFDGVIENGVLWGRGAIDTKVTLNSILTAAEVLIKEGYTPKRDVYFAFGADEEINGYGAKSIAEKFKKNGIKLGMVLDEGGAVVNGAFPGVNKPCALVGIAEKGMVNIEYSVTSPGGHSSAPVKNLPTERLSRACLRVVKHPFKLRLTEPVLKMFDVMGRNSAFVYRLVFANLWLFSPVLNFLSKNGGELSATLRTTTAFTVMRGSDAMNVIPTNASMISNHRILPGESVDDVAARIKRIVADDDVAIRIVEGMNPSAVSTTEGEAWSRIFEAASRTFSDVIVSPYLMFACSDSKHYSSFCDKVYRFSPLTLTKEERETIHANNEKISVSQIQKSFEFYYRLLKKS